MNHNPLKFVLLLLMGVQIFLNSFVNSNAEEDSWMEPDAWARDHFSMSSLETAMGKCCKCPEENSIVPDTSSLESNGKTPIYSEDAASLIYLKKFLTMLFNRKYFKYDSTLQLYERSIVFSVQSSQMDKLEKLQDPRDLDSILVEIFRNVRTPNMYSDGHMHHYMTESSSSGFKQLVFDLFYDMWELTKTSELKFLVGVALFILFVWFLHTRINVALWKLVIGSFFIFGYLYTYLECNRELEVKKMLEVINRDKGNENVAKESNFFKFLKGIFSSDDTLSLQEQRLKQSAKLSLGFCRPDDVLILYLNDMFLKNLQALIEHFATTLTKLNSILGFPYNIFSGFILVILIGYILKLVFKYMLSPAAWAQFMHRRQSKSITNSTNSNGDHLSGDNLKLILNALTSTPEVKAIPIRLPLTAAVSGVEEVRESLEALPKNNSPQKETNIPKRKQSNNNNSNENSLGEITDVQLEDLPDES